MKLPFLLLLSMGHISLNAQNRSEFWSKLNTSFSINQHFTASADWQFRTQSAYHSNSRNLFDHNRMQSMRFWLIYKTKSNTDILLSPVAGFIISDYGLNNDWINTHEIRHAVGIQKTSKHQTITFKSRFLFEFRHFKVPINTFNYRARLQMQVNFPLFKIQSTAVGVLILEEYFYQLFEMRMDNNRIMTGIQIESGRFELQTGIQWQRTGTWHSGSNIFQSNTTLNCKF
jgi:hypothetical protein